MSQFVWLDSSQRERLKMLDVVVLSGEHDTRDEFGIGSLRDRFRDTLLPGTSTIMNRARYFLLLPHRRPLVQAGKVVSRASAQGADWRSSE
jgi:hypothetical protein